MALLLSVYLELDSLVMYGLSEPFFQYHQEGPASTHCQLIVRLANDVFSEPEVNPVRWAAFSLAGIHRISRPQVIQIPSERALDT